MKYIFVTGGVVSSLGKGLAGASLGTLLERRGLKVILQKFDPYLNIDPGTMSPYQHGEVYVLDDGAETDLDLGHYERFTSSVLTRDNNLTSGQVFEHVLKKERRGDYLGKTVQFIPHVTDVIKERIRKVAKEQGGDVIITEIGGTTGDIEGLPFLEAIRQFSLEAGPENVLFMHVTLVPFLQAAGELKTKPTQQSVAKLREIGIAPQVLLCRAEKPLDADLRQKISLFCNVPLRAVVEVRDVENTVYELPLKLHEEHLDQTVCDLLHIDAPPPDLDTWITFVDRVVHPSKKIKVALVGKYIELPDAYKSVMEALTHAGAAHDTGIEIVPVQSTTFRTEDPHPYLKDCDGILVPGGFGDRGVEGKIKAAQYARENAIPYFGLCLGLQVAVIEFARNVCGLERANSIEFDPETPHPVITLLAEQREVEEKGASMRLGTCESNLVAGTQASALYGSTTIAERHRHRYEFNQNYRETMEDHGLVFSGLSPDGALAEIIELSNHPFYLATQFHPEFLSNPLHPHPLFSGFVRAAMHCASAKEK